MRSWWGIALLAGALGCGCTSGADPGAKSATSPSQSQSPSASSTPSALPTSSPTPSASPTLRSAPPSPAPRRTPRRIPTPTPTFEATRRGSDEGPDYHAVFVGQNFGGDGNYNVYAACRPGHVTVIVHQAGTKPGSDNHYPFGLSISVEDKTVVYRGTVHDGQVISGTVRARVRIVTTGINESPFRIEYDCR